MWRGSLSGRLSLDLFIGATGTQQLTKKEVLMTSTVTNKAKKIKASLGFEKVPDNDLLKRLDAICVGLTGNSAFTNLPVDIGAFKAAVDSYHVLTTDALDGGKKAVSAKRKQRAVVIQMATQLGHYVEAACNNDFATFTTSGFVAVSNMRTLPQPLAPAAIKWVDRGPTSGSILVKVTGLRGALTYDLRYALFSAGGTPGSWISLTLTSPKTVTLNNLTPGATYVFQVRALGKLGCTDWSDSTTFICG
jgi:hypothetical protein